MQRRERQCKSNHISLVTPSESWTGFLAIWQQNQTLLIHTLLQNVALTVLRVNTPPDETPALGAVTTWYDRI